MRSSSALKVAMALSGPHASVTSAAHTNDVCSSDSSGGRSMLNTTAATPPVVATPISPTMKMPRRQRHRKLRSLPGASASGAARGSSAACGRRPRRALVRARRRGAAAWREGGVRASGGRDRRASLRSTAEPSGSAGVAPSRLRPQLGDQDDAPRRRRQRAAPSPDRGRRQASRPRPRRRGATARTSDADAGDQRPPPRAPWPAAARRAPDEPVATSAPTVATTPATHARPSTSPAGSRARRRPRRPRHRSRRRGHVQRAGRRGR